MKLKTMNRAAAAMLALALTAALTGCGNTAASSESAEASSSSAAESGSESAAESTAADDSAYAYLADFNYAQAFDENGYLVGIKASDYVTLPEDYADITLSADLGTVSDASLNSYINENVLSQFATTEQVTDRAAEDGDTVNIDFVGSVDGVEFEGGNTQGKGYDLVLGSGTFIPGFEDQIVGHTPGESFDVQVTFPEDYGKEELNGKAAVFKTTLNYISVKVTPELSDEWVAENLAPTMAMSNVEELNDFVKKSMLYDQQSGEVYKALCDKVTFADELPQSVLDYYRDVVLMEVYRYAKNYGTDMATILSARNYESVDAYLEDMQPTITNFTQQQLLMQAIAEKQGMKCDDAALAADFSRFFGSNDPSRYISTYGENYVKMNVLQSEVMQSLIDNVKYE